MLDRIDEPERIDQKTYHAHIPRSAFDRAGVEPDGAFAKPSGDMVLVTASPGTVRSIGWLCRQTAGPEVRRYLPEIDGAVDEGVIWARAANAAAQSTRHPNDPSKSYPETVWSDAVAKALGLPCTLWREMETGARVSVTTWENCE